MSKSLKLWEFINTFSLNVTKLNSILITYMSIQINTQNDEIRYSYNFLLSQNIFVSAVPIPYIHSEGILILRVIVDYSQVKQVLSE